MKKTAYKFVWKSCGITNTFYYECDADAMMAAREFLETQKLINPREQVQVYAVKDDNRYRFVVAYK